MCEPKRVTFFRLIDVIAVFLNVSSVSDVLLTHVLKTVSGNLISLKFVQYAKAPVPIELNPVNLSSSLNVCISVFDLNLVPSGLSLTSLGSKFQSNSLITKFNELLYFNVTTHTYNRNEFGYCSSLIELDLRKWTSVGINASQVFYNNQKLVKLNCASVTSFGCTASLNDSRSWMKHCYAFKRLILPSVVTYGRFSEGTKRNSYFPQVEMIDLGHNAGVAGQQIEEFQNTTVIIRNETPKSGGSINASGIKLFVPANSVESYKTTSPWSSAATSTYAIGGAEWIAEFGSADEYANLTEQEYTDTYGWLAEQG